MPTPTGNAWLEFTWNGTPYTLGYVNITSYEQSPQYADDGYTLNAYAIKVAGTALVADTTSTFTELARNFREGTGRVERVRILTAQGGTETLLDVSYPDAQRGPHLSLTVNEINGRRAAVVSFSASAHTSLGGSTDGSPNPAYPIISHRWGQTFSLEATGRITRTVRGTLVVNLAGTGASVSVAADGTVASVTGTAPWADLFRKAVAPALTVPNQSLWRRDSQTYTLNESGTALIYEVQDSQHRTALPDGAFHGNADFTYERVRSNLAFANLRFSCDLEGGPYQDARQLIWGAVSIATSRIPFAQAIIERMTVTESEMLSKCKIRFEVEAKAPAVSALTPGTTSLGVPLAALVGNAFTVSRTCSFRTGEYGPSGSNAGVGGIPTWFGNDTSAKPGLSQALAAADVFVHEDADCPAGTPTTVLVVSDVSFSTANGIINQGPFPNQQVATYNTSGQVTTVEKVTTHTHVQHRTRMHRLQTLYDQGSDFVFQAGKASVIVEEQATVRRTNLPPNRIFRPIPAGFLVLEDDWRVNHGDIDPAGHRTFTGVWTRRLLSYDTGGLTSNGYSTVSGRRQWWVPGADPSVASPVALGYDLTAQSTATNVIAFGANAQAYPVGPAQDYV